MLTPDDAGTILSDLVVFKMQSVEESSSQNVSTPRVVISELKCHGGYPHYIRFGPPDVALPVTLLLLLGRTKGVHDGSRIRPASRFIIGLLCWISRASRTYLLPKFSSLTRILASCQLMVCAVFWKCIAIPFL